MKEVIKNKKDTLFSLRSVMNVFISCFLKFTNLLRTDTFNSFPEVKVDRALRSSRKETNNCEHKLPKLTTSLKFYCPCCSHARHVRSKFLRHFTSAFESQL